MGIHSLILGSGLHLSISKRAHFITFTFHLLPLPWFYFVHFLQLLQQCNRVYLADDSEITKCLEFEELQMTTEYDDITQDYYMKKFRCFNNVRLSF